ncbi:hypothetical protein MPTK1_2g18405 [Marchantia polymorpha subsp. ruderalis]
MKGQVLTPDGLKVVELPGSPGDSRDCSGEFDSDDSVSDATPTSSTRFYRFPVSKLRQLLVKWKRSPHYADSMELHDSVIEKPISWRRSSRHLFRNYMVPAEVQSN